MSFGTIESSPAPWAPTATIAARVHTFDPALKSQRVFGKNLVRACGRVVADVKFTATGYLIICKGRGFGRNTAKISPVISPRRAGTSSRETGRTMGLATTVLAITKATSAPENMDLNFISGNLHHAARRKQEFWRLVPAPLLA
jgi:hypothetical protein